MRKFFRGRNGTVLLEAAVAMPVLVAILLGMAEFGEAFTIRRKNAQVAATAADLVAQAASVTTANLTDIAAIAGTIMRPYSSTPIGIRISSVIQNANNATVQWSFGSGSLSGSTAGSAYSLPSGLIAQNQTIIVAQSSYAFTPAIGNFITGPVTFSSVAYYTPRVGTAVSCC